MRKLTPAEQEAMRAFDRDPLVPGTCDDRGVLMDGCGVRRATAASLVRLGLCEWAEEPRQITRYGLRGRGRYVTKWAIRRAGSTR